MKRPTTLLAIISLTAASLLCASAIAGERDLAPPRIALPTVNRQPASDESHSMRREFKQLSDDASEPVGSVLNWSRAIAAHRSEDRQHEVAARGYEMERLKHHPVDHELDGEYLGHHPESGEHYHVNPSPVPLPGAALLLASGLAGLAGLRRGKNSK